MSREVVVVLTLWCGNAPEGQRVMHSRYVNTGEVFTVRGAGTFSGPTLRECERQAVAKGWILRKSSGGKDICPCCAKGEV